MQGKSKAEQMVDAISIIAKEAARRFAEEGHKVLFLCFNTLLCADLKHRYINKNVYYPTTILKKQTQTTVFTAKVDVTNRNMNSKKVIPPAEAYIHQGR